MSALGPLTPFDSLFATGLLTYAFHSTVVLALVWCVTRRGPLARWPAQTVLWKGAAVAGILTAAIQTTMIGAPGGDAPEPFRSWPLGPELERPFGGVVHQGAVEAPRILRRVRVHVAEEAPALGRKDAVRDVHVRRLVQQTSGPASDARPVTRTIARAEARGSACAAELRRRIRSTLDSPGGPAPQALRALMNQIPAESDGCTGMAGVNWSAWILAIWLLGAAAGAIRGIGLNRRLARATRPSWPGGPGPRATLDALLARCGEGAVQLAESPGLGTPLALTGRRVLLPAYASALMSDGELEAALAHELGHIVSHDPAWLLVLRWVEAVFFFQPLNRLARRRFQDASEFVADAWAVRHTGRPLNLARSLEKVSSWNRPGPVQELASTMARRESSAVERVRAMLAPPEAQSRRAVALQALVLAPVLLLPPVRAPETPRLRVLVIQEVIQGSTGAAPPPAPETGGPPSDFGAEHPQPNGAPSATSVSHRILEVRGS